MLTCYGKVVKHQLIENMKKQWEAINKEYQRFTLSLFNLDTRVKERQLLSLGDVTDDSDSRCTRRKNVRGRWRCWNERSRDCRSAPSSCIPQERFSHGRRRVFTRCDEVKVKESQSWYTSNHLDAFVSAM